MSGRYVYDPWSRATRWEPSPVDWVGLTESLGIAKKPIGQMTTDEVLEELADIETLEEVIRERNW